MEIRIRTATPDDAAACGRIIYNAFKHIADRHVFPPDFPSADFATLLVESFVESPSIFAVVAEADGRIVGSNFLTEHDPIRAVGPITVDPEFQGHRVGRRLMEAVLERGRDAAGIRLLQDAFNLTSMTLYASLGFEVKEPLVVMAGRIEGFSSAAFDVRPMEAEDLDACESLCQKTVGFGRTGELGRLPPFAAPFVATRDGRVEAYASAPSFWPLNHAVAETEDAMRALLAGASAASPNGLSFILPTRVATLFRWCLGQGLRAVKPMTLMAIGQYEDPKGCYLPSVGY
jgi:predicted N-acetyltransferase YhbS